MCTSWCSYTLCTLVQVGSLACYVDSWVYPHSTICTVNPSMLQAYIGFWPIPHFCRFRIFYQLKGSIIWNTSFWVCPEVVWETANKVVAVGYDAIAIHTCEGVGPTLSSAATAGRLRDVPGASGEGIGEHSRRWTTVLPSILHYELCNLTGRKHKQHTKPAY